MKKLILVYIILIFAVILLAVVKAGGSFNLPLPFGKSVTAEINGTKINLIVVKNDHDRQKGLSGKKSLDKNQGMLFVFDKPDRYGFWMKDMLFSIDIIYIDGNKVVYIVKNAPSSLQVPNLTIYQPSEPANYVLELTSGMSDKLKLQEGTKVTFKGL